MDIRISGKGTVSQGEYNKVSVSGSSFLYGNVRCESFSSSGTTKGEKIECAERFKANGTTRFSSNVTAKDICISGSFSCDGKIESRENFSCSGSAKCKKSIKSKDLCVAGNLSVCGDIESENAKISGALVCGGAIRANKIEIVADKTMNIGQIKGGDILIKRKPVSIFFKRGVAVSHLTEGENLCLEHFTCPEVVGRVVTIGKGCKIDTVRYNDEIKIHSKSKVEKIEKI